MKRPVLAGIALVVAGLALYRPDEPKPTPEPDKPAVEPEPPASGKPATMPTDAPRMLQDESEAMKAWKAKKAALDALGPTVKRPDQVWSPINDTRSIAMFYKLPPKVQSNMWNHVYKQQAEVMAKYVAYMEAQNALDAEKPPQ